MPEGRMMYEACTICDQSQSHRILTENRGWIDCPACQPLRVAPVGVTVEQLDRLRTEAPAATEGLESSLRVILGEACGELQCGKNPRESIKRIVKIAAYGLSGADEQGSDAAEAWLRDYLERHEYPKDLL